MGYRNFINLNDKEESKPIYRITPIYRLLKALRNQKLTLLRPSKWDDPYENSFLSALFQTSDGERGTFPAKDSVFALCWSLHKETDALWRIYSQNNQGVKIKTTPSKLFEALKSSYPDMWELSCFIGKVRYLSTTKMQNALDKLDLFNTNGSGIAEALLYKRKEFFHEKEVRIIYSMHNNNPTSDILHFNIDTNKLIDEIVFDPFMKTELVDAYTLAIRNLGYNNTIQQSKLYKIPGKFIKKV